MSEPAPYTNDLEEDEEAPQLLVWRIAESSSPRLDAFLGDRLREGGHSRAEIQGWISAGRVRIHRKDQELPSVRRALRLKEGDEVLVRPPPAPPPPEPIQPEDLSVPLLHQDEVVLVLNKPAGLTVHPGAGQRSGTLVSALLHISPGRLSEMGGEERPGIVHRLDKDTSGVIVVARSDAAHRDLARQFHDRLVKKRYLALVEGAPPAEGLIDQPLGRHPKDRKKMAVVEGGRSAQTEFTRLEQWGPYALVEARPKTGRTHQIRVHLKSIGCPIVADATYGKRAQLTAADLGAEGDPARPLLARHALHAATLEFTHPQSGERVRFEAPLAEDIQATIQALRGLYS